MNSWPSRGTPVTSRRRGAPAGGRWQGVGRARVHDCTCTHVRGVGWGPKVSMIITVQRSHEGQWLSSLPSPTTGHTWLSAWRMHIAQCVVKV